MTPRKGKRLRRGDVIGLVAPASPPRSRQKVEAGVRYLEGLGYRVKLGRNVDAKRGYLAGTDAQRLEDLNGMFRDRQVRAIFAMRGGYGSPRLLPFIDYAAVRRDPKVLVGMSDLTGLQLALWRRASLLTFSGPMLETDFGGVRDAYTEEMFWDLVTSNRRWMGQPAGQRLRTLRPGRVEGRLLGGNLSLVVSNLGTPYHPQYQGALLFLEEIGEPLYRVDRMLTQLRNAGVMQRIGALICGQFTESPRSEGAQETLMKRQLWEEVASWFNGPMVDGLSYGHVTTKLTVPIGVQARLDTRRGRLELLECVVR
jgi:muramoyltetrapeptide carboxypeptidase